MESGLQGPVRFYKPSRGNDDTYSDLSADAECMSASDSIFQESASSMMELLMSSNESPTESHVVGKGTFPSRYGELSSTSLCLSERADESGLVQPSNPEECLEAYVSRILGLCGHGLEMEQDFLREIMTHGMEKSFSNEESVSLFSLGVAEKQLRDSADDIAPSLFLSSDTNEAPTQSSSATSPPQLTPHSMKNEKVDQESLSPKRINQSEAYDLDNAVHGYDCSHLQVIGGAETKTQGMAISIDWNPPSEIRTRTPQEVRTFHVRASITGYSSISDLPDLRVRAELMYAPILGIVERIERVPDGHKILGGNEDWVVEDPGEILLPGLTMCDTSARHREREFCLRISLFHISNPDEALAEAFTTPFYTYSHRKVLERRKVGRGRLRDALDPRPHGMPDLPESPARWIRKKKRKGQARNDSMEPSPNGSRKSLRLNKEKQGRMLSFLLSECSDGTDSDTTATSSKDDCHSPQEIENQTAKLLGRWKSPRKFA